MIGFLISVGQVIFSLDFAVMLIFMNCLLCGEIVGKFFSCVGNFGDLVFSC